MRHGSVITAVFLLSSCVTLIAQGQEAAPQPGARLRLTFPCELQGQPSPGERRMGCRSAGRLVRLQSDTLTLDAAASTRSYSVRALSRVEISRGTRSHRLAGAGAGLLVGGGVAFALLHTGGSTSLCDRSANQDAIGSSECIGLAALGGLAGAGLGAIIGGFVRSERWQDVPLERLRVSLRPQAGSRLGMVLAEVF